MFTEEKNNDDHLEAVVVAKGFYTPPPKWNSRTPFSPPKNWMSEDKKKTNYSSISPNSHLFHVIHKVPSGDSPYVKAKHVQLIDKDPSRAVALFWNAINSGDHVDSALKDMAVVMKQLNRSNEAIEAIKSFRHLCSSDSQESIDNVLVELYKRSGRLEEQIEVLQLKLKRVEEGNTFGGKRVKLARSQGKKVHITVEQEYARLLGNLAWAYLQLNDYKTAEEYYRKALSIESDRNKQCNLAICLMCMNRISEAKFLLQVIRASAPEGQMDESYAKSFERASELLAEIESQPDKSWFQERENGCGKLGFYAFTPDKKACECIQSNIRRVSDDQLDLKDGNCSEDSFTKANVGSSSNTTAVEANFSWKRTYTPSTQARGIPRSPFTQPKRSSSLSDSGSWRKGTYRNEPKICMPRRLQFENPADSNFLRTRDLKSNDLETGEHGSVNMTMSSDSTSDRTTPDHRKENLPPTNFSPHKLSTSPSGEGTETTCAGIESKYSCYAHNNKWVFPSYKGQSWADMAEEDEEEMMHPFSGENFGLNVSENLHSPEENLSRKLRNVSVNEDGEVASKQSSPCQTLFFNQQQKLDPVKPKRSNRLQVFKDIIPESPRA